MSMFERTVLPPAEDDDVFRAIITELGTIGASELALADGTRIPLPEEIADVLRDVARALSHGQAVTVAPQHTTLTTQQAAEVLNVSRPTFVKLLESGALPYTRPGRHRRVRLADVLAYHEQSRHGRHAALDEMAKVSDDAGLYSDEVTRTRLRR